MLFIQESLIDATPAEVFAFHEEPGALERLTPPWEKVVLVERGDSLKPGTRVVLRSWLGPIPLTWVAVHTEYDPPHLFADRQESGPFAAWYHRHRFLDDGHGRTILRDEVEYEPPMGRLGRLLSGPMLESKLKRMFEYRHEQTRRLLAERREAGTGAAAR
jgi:ligand-binding SRPBCC domain-containing protein